MIFDELKSSRDAGCGSDDLERQLQEERGSGARKDTVLFILSHILEFRNGESGSHITHIFHMTGALLRELCQVSDKYHFSREEIETASLASILHDIGKLNIHDEILKKAGKLTAEEFSVIKDHAMLGAYMIRDLPLDQDSALIKAAYEICRWHHERYDGGGYPDKLVGDEIPIFAQVVGLADVYDALVSDRIYKKGIDHDKAVQIILNNECGAFAPVLLECLTRISDQLRELYSRSTGY